MAIPAKKAQKITVTIPHELKEQLYALKKELRTSMSTILQGCAEGLYRAKGEGAMEKSGRVDGAGI